MRFLGEVRDVRAGVRSGRRFWIAPGANMLGAGLSMHQQQQ